MYSTNVVMLCQLRIQTSGFVDVDIDRTKETNHEVLTTTIVIEVCGPRRHQFGSHPLNRPRMPSRWTKSVRQ